MAKQTHKARTSRETDQGHENGAAAAAPDPRLLIIARAIGRLIARELADAAKHKP